MQGEESYLGNAKRGTGPKKDRFSTERADRREHCRATQREDADHCRRPNSAMTRAIAPARSHFAGASARGPSTAGKSSVASANARRVPKRAEATYGKTFLKKLRSSTQGLLQYNPLLSTTVRCPLVVAASQGRVIRTQVQRTFPEKERTNLLCIVDDTS